MKTNIIKNIVDTDKLSGEIEKFEIINNQRAYIFMNEETIDCMSTMFKESYPFMKELNNSSRPLGIIAKFQGHKVYIDDDLKFGEVEIR